MSIKKFKSFAKLMLATGLILSFNTLSYGDSPPSAQIKDLGYSFHEKNNVTQDVTTLTTELFGDRIDLASGSISFEQTDISIPGNSALPVAITRTLTDPNSWYRETRDFENWSLSIPHVRSAYVSDPDGVATVGANGSSYWEAGKACSRPLGSYPTYRINFSGEAYWAHSKQYWNGDSVSIPGHGTARFTQKEGDTSFKRYNTKNWDVECISSATGPEGFKVTLDDGIVYTFTQQRIVRSLKPFRLSPHVKLGSCSDNGGFCSSGPIKGGPVSPPDYKIELPQNYIFMLATKVEDRFGNWVEYEYNNEGRLKKITSNDDRTINIFYTNGRISSIKALEKTWQYKYSEDSGDLDEIKTLAEVILPDETKKWTYTHEKLHEKSYWSRRNIADFSSFLPRVSDTFCLALRAQPFITIIHPEGTRGDFGLMDKCHGQSNVPKIPLNDYSLTGIEIFGVPKENALTSINTKKLTLSDGTEYLWDYQFSNNLGVFKGDNIEASHRLKSLNIEDVETANFKSTTVINPDGSKTIHYFDRRFGRTSGNLAYRENYNSEGELLRRSSFEYIDGTYHGSPKTYTYVNGATVPFTEEDIKVGEAASRQQLISKEVEQLFYGTNNSDTYTKTYSGYDVYDYPQLTAEANSFSNKTRYIKQTYHHDKAKNMLGLLRTTQLSNDGVNYTTVKETEYYPASHSSYSFLPKYEKTYGQWKLFFSSYHSDGNVNKIEYNAELTFGVGNRYQIYSDFKRGQPQTITVPNRYSSGTFSGYQVIDYYGKVIKITDFNANTTNFGYDDLGRLAYVDDSSWKDTLLSWSYTGGSNANQPIRTVKRCTLNWSKTQCSDTPKLTSTTTYDSLLRPVKIATTDGTSTVYHNNSFNAYNKPLFQSFPSRESTEAKGIRFIYDGLQRLNTESISNGGTTLYEYISGNKIKVTNAKNHPTTTSYLAYGQPNYQQAIKILSPENITTSMGIDTFDNITSITQSGNHKDTSISQTEYRAYNSQQQLCKISRTDVGQTVFSYNNFGEIQWKADGINAGTATDCNHSVSAAQKNNFSYDNLGEIRTSTFADSTPDVTYTRDNNGNLTKLVSGFTQWDYKYNGHNLVEKQTLSIDNQSFVVDHEYNSLGHLESFTFPSGRKISFSPNAFGQATKAERYATNANYHPNGSLKSFAYGNGLIYSRTLDHLQRPYDLIVSQSSTKKLHQRYVYDNNNNIDNIYDFTNRSYDIDLGYDDVDRLIAASGIWGSGSINYDALGNITHKNLGGKNLSYNYNSNKQLDNVSGSLNYGFSYDSRGNIEHNGRYGLIFNRAGQLTNAKGNSYTYDGHNRLVKKVANGKTTYSVYGLDGMLYHRIDADGKKVDYIRLGTELVAKDNSPVAVAPPSVPLLTTAPILSGYAVDAQNLGNTFKLSWQYDNHTNVSYYQVFSSGIGSVKDPGDVFPDISVNKSLAKTLIKIDNEWTQIYQGTAKQISKTINSNSVDFKVRACNAKGCSPYSAVVTIDAASSIFF